MAHLLRKYVIAPTDYILFRTVGADSISAHMKQTERTKQYGGAPNPPFYCRDRGLNDFRSLVRIRKIERTTIRGVEDVAPYRV